MWLPLILLVAGCGSRYSSAPSEKAEPSTASPAPQQAPADEGLMGARRARMESELDASLGAKPDMATGASSDLRALGYNEQEPALRKKARPVVPQEPALDWGATVWLSNDDSMSLASAQRVLYALKNNVAFSAANVRPHELLNYFSFDTAPVRGDDVFSVVGSAAVTDENQLTVALAVKGATPPRIPLDLTLVVDRSGSMSGEGRIDYVRKALHLLAGNLQSGDTVNLVAFDNRVDVFLEDYTVGSFFTSKLDTAIDKLKPRDSTDLNAGLRKGYALAIERAQETRGEGRNNRVILLTDALLNTGEVDINVVSEVGRAFDEHGIRLTGVGVGSEFNDQLLDKLTEKGKGAYVFLGSEAVVDRIFGSGFESLTRTVAHDVRFAINLPQSLAMKRFYGEESSTNPEEVQPINYYSGTTQVFLQDLQMRGYEPNSSDPISLTMSFKDAVTGEPREQVWNTSLGALLGADSRNMVKARTLMAWSDVLLAKAMRNDPCGEPMATFLSRKADIRDDAEIAYISTLSQSICPSGAQVSERVAYKVRIDGDQPIAEVEMACSNGWKGKKRLNAGEKVVTFQAPPGQCRLNLEGAVPMTTSVMVPKTSGDVRCVVRGGRFTCG